VRAAFASTTRRDQGEFAGGDAGAEGVAAGALGLGAVDGWVDGVTVELVDAVFIGALDAVWVLGPPQ
jgi:hypothetical protein